MASKLAILAQKLGISEDDLIAQITQNPNILADFEKTKKQLGFSQEIADTVFSKSLNTQLDQLISLSNKRQGEVKASSTQPAKAKAADQLNKDNAKIVAKLQEAISGRDATRKSAFENTFQRTQLDVGTPGKGARAKGILDELTHQTDVIRNGSKAATALQTDTGFGASLYRNIFGNTFADGVSAQKKTFDNLQSTSEKFSQTNNTFFTNALKKDAPLAESLASSNADLKVASSSASALEANLLIAPTQSALDATATAQGIATTRDIVATNSKLFDVQKDANARGVRDNQSLFSNSIGAGSAARAGASSLFDFATNGAPLGADGNPLDTSAREERDAQNRSTILGNQTFNSDGQVAVAKGTGKFNVAKQTRLNDNKERTTRYAQVDTEIRAQSRGIRADGTYDPTIVEQGREKFIKELVTQNIKSGIEQKLIENKLDNLELNIETQNLSDAQKNAIAKADGKNLSLALANEEAQLEVTKGELDQKIVKINLAKENEANWTETQRRQFKIEFAKTGVELDEYRNEELQFNLKKIKLLGASTDASEAEIRNKYSTDPASKEFRIESAVLVAKSNYKEAVLNASPKAAFVAATKLNNSLSQALIDTQVLEAEKKFIASPDFVNNTSDAKIAQLAAFRAQQQGAKLKALADLANQPTVAYTSRKQLENLQKETDAKSKLFNDGTYLAKKNEEARLQQQSNKGILKANIAQTLTDTQQAEARIKAYNNIATNPKPQGYVFDKDTAAALDYIVTNGKLGDDPIMSANTLNAFVDVNDRSPVFKQTLLELESMKSALGFTKLGQNSNGINIKLNSLLNATGTIDIDSDKKTNSLLDFPSYTNTLGMVPAPMAEAIGSIGEKWDTATPLEKLAGLKDFYTAKAEENGGEVIQALISKQIADTMKSVMVNKARVGRFKQLGIPEITEMNYKLEISTLFSSDDKITPANPFNSAVFGDGLFGLLPSSKEKVDIDVFSPVSINKLIKGGVL